MYLASQVAAEWLYRREEDAARGCVYGIALYKVEYSVRVLLGVVRVQAVEAHQT